MKKLFAIITVAILVGLISLIFLQKRTSQSEEFNISFNQELTTSNAPAPKLIVTKISTNSAHLSWTKKVTKYVTKKDIAPEYAIHSGYRIYRNNYWYADTSQMSIDDTSLLSNQKYEYQIAELTFDNKIEGMRSSPTNMTTIDFTEVKYPVINISSIQTYMAEGDSISAGQRAAQKSGWVDQVGDYLKKTNNAKIINKSVPDSTSTDVLNRIESELTEYNPDLVTISVGINDLIGASEQKGNTSIYQYQKNIEKIINITSQDSNRKIILAGISILNCCANPEHNNMKLTEWNNTLKSIAIQRNIMFIDVARSMNARGGLELLDDKLHPNQKGHDTIAAEVINYLNSSK